LARLEQQAKALRAAITCIADDIRAVDLPAAHFTIVVASTVLDHLTKEECTLLVPRILRALTAHGYLYASVFTVVDPGYTLDGPQSDTAKYVKRYFGHGELRDLFPELRTLAYQEEYALDASHGVPHYHGIARILSHRSA
jgi:cyclopropane fatty-acyl-phospholipid synthase-like methyltransferase